MDWEAHHIEVVPGDTSHEAAPSALNTIAASFVHGFSRINVALQCNYVMFINIEKWLFELWPQNCYQNYNQSSIFLFIRCSFNSCTRLLSLSAASYCLPASKAGSNADLSS